MAGVLRVCDLVTTHIISAPSDTPCDELARQMLGGQISSVVIIDDGRLSGIVTEHDIVGKVVARGVDPSGITARKIMSSPVVTVDYELDLDAAARLMRDKRIKKVLAVKDGKLKGILTSYDIIVAEPVLSLLIGD